MLAMDNTPDTCREMGPFVWYPAAASKARKVTLLGKDSDGDSIERCPPAAELSGAE